MWRETRHRQVPTPRGARGAHGLRRGCLQSLVRRVLASAFPLPTSERAVSLLCLATCRDRGDVPGGPGVRVLECNSSWAGGALQAAPVPSNVTPALWAHWETPGPSTAISFRDLAQGLYEPFCFSQGFGSKFSVQSCWVGLAQCPCGGCTPVPPGGHGGRREWDRRATSRWAR